MDGTDEEESNSSEVDVTETTVLSRSLTVKSGRTLAIAVHPFIDNSVLLTGTNFCVKGCKINQITSSAMRTQISTLVEVIPQRLSWILGIYELHVQYSWVFAFFWDNIHSLAQHLTLASHVASIVETN